MPLLGETWKRPGRPRSQEKTRMADNGKTHDTVLEATGALARLARVYAEALMAAAGKGHAEAVGDELDALANDVLAGHPDVERFLSSGAIGRKAKGPVLEKALGSGVSDVLR